MNTARYHLGAAARYRRPLPEEARPPTADRVLGVAARPRQSSDTRILALGLRSETRIGTGTETETGTGIGNGTGTGNEKGNEIWDGIGPVIGTGTPTIRLVRRGEALVG